MLNNIPDLRTRIINETKYEFEGKILDEIKGILISTKEYEERMAFLGKQIINKYKNENPLLVYILKGSAKMHEVLFPSDYESSFAHTRKYVKANSTQGTQVGDANYGDELSIAIRGMNDRNVIIFEDIVDSGGTLNGIIKKMNKNNIRPKNLEICTATYKIDKLKEENKDIQNYLSYVGFIIPDNWIIGRGLDLDGKYRDLADICVLTDETIKKYS